MLRTGVKNKTAVKKTNGLVDIRSEKEKKKSKKVLTENKLTINTRSKSIKSETVQKKIEISTPKHPRKTRSNCKENILHSPNLSPRKTRSKSEKIPIIPFDSSPIRQQQQTSAKKENNRNQLSKERFVKLNEIKVDSIVLAKQKYSIPWPAKILQIEKERVFVYFFGDKRSGYVSKGEIYDFILSANALKSIIASKKKQRTFCTGIAEVELLMSIPSDKSMLAI